jgi:hypothetical protein
MKERWDVEYVTFQDFAFACRNRATNNLWNRLVKRIDLVMGGVDFTSNFAFVASDFSKHSFSLTNLQGIT